MSINVVYLTASNTPLIQGELKKCKSNSGTIL